MPKLIAFNQVSLDGYFAGPGGDLSWAHGHDQDAEWNAFVDGNATSGGVLVFGRVTYELMASFWPTPQAIANLPALAAQMNALPKIVFSRSLDRATWNNTRLVNGDLANEVRRLKETPGRDMAILGSGSIIAQLAGEGLIDEFQVVVNAIALGAGKTMFEGVGRKLALRLTNTRVFQNGKVLLCYAPS